MPWWGTDDVLMTPWWCTDDALMMHWWCTDDALMMHWWCTEDALMMHWWCHDGAPMMAMVSFWLTPPPPFVSNGQHLPADVTWYVNSPLKGGGEVIPRHDICQICYTSLFPKIQKFTRRKHADRDISSPLVWQFGILKLELYPNILLAGSLNTLSLAYMTEYYQKQNDSYINCSKSTFKM